MAQLLTCHWSDCDDGGGWTHYHLLDGADPSPWLSALEAHSNALLDEWAIGAVHSLSGTTSGQPYSQVRDKAGLRFCTPAGPCTVAYLPGPHLAIFFGGTSEVDPSQIGDIIAAGLAVLTDVTGHAVTRYDTGYRGRGA